MYARMYRWRTLILLLLVSKDVFQFNKEQKGDVHAYLQQTKSMKQAAKA